MRLFQWTWRWSAKGRSRIGPRQIAGNFWNCNPCGCQGRWCDYWRGVGCSCHHVWLPDRPWSGWRGVRCVCVRGDNTLLSLQRCRKGDQEGPDSTLNISLTMCLNPGYLGVSPQRGTQVSRIREREKTQTKSGNDSVSCMVAEKRRPCCVRGREFLP